MKFFLAGMNDFTVTTQQLAILPGQQQQEVNFTLEPDTICQEPPETFQIVAVVSDGQIRPLADNEFLQLTKVVTIIDRTSKEEQLTILVCQP